VNHGHAYSLILAGLTTFHANQMWHWYIAITGGPGAGQAALIVGNGDTYGSGLTLVYLDSTNINGDTTSDPLSPLPTNASTYMLTPLNQFEIPLLTKDVKNIRLSDFEMTGFAGYIGISNGENVWVNNVRIENPAVGYHYVYPALKVRGSEWLAGNSALVFWSSVTDNRCSSVLYPSGGAQPMTYASKNIYITNSTLGGYYGNIYFEAESGYASKGHENIYIDNCTLLSGRMIFGGSAGTKYRNVHVSNCTFRKACGWTAIDFSGIDSTAESIVIDKCTFDSVSTGIYFNSTAKNITISNCIFNNVTYPITSTGGVNISLVNNKFNNCTHSVNLYLSGFNKDLIKASKDIYFTTAPNWTGTGWARDGSDSTYIHTSGTAAATLTATNMYNAFFDTLRRCSFYIKVKNGLSPTTGTLLIKLGTQTICTLDTAGSFGYSFTIGNGADGAVDLTMTPSSDWNGRLDSLHLYTNIRESRGWTITKNSFKDCGIGDVLDCPMFVGGLYNSSITDNKFVISDSSVLKVNVPFYVAGGDSLFIMNNTSVGFLNNTPFINTSANNVQFGNAWGFGSTGSAVSSVFDPAIRIGNTGVTGDTSAEASTQDETKRVFVGLSGYINSYPDIYGAKIIGQSWSWGYPAAQVSYNNLLFKVLTSYPDNTPAGLIRNADYLKSKAVLTNMGLGIGLESVNQRTTGADNKSYLIWFNADAVRDSLAWKYVGHDSLREGLMDSAGVMKWRNRGSSTWTAFSNVPSHSHTDYLRKSGADTMNGAWNVGYSAVDIGTKSLWKALLGVSVLTGDASTAPFWVGKGSTDYLTVANNGNVTVANPLSVMTDMIFVGVKTATFAATRGMVWVSGDTLFHKYDASNSRFWLKDGTTTKH